MSGLSEDQVREHQEAFLLFDRRGDSKIDSSQLGDVLRSLSLNPTVAEVTKMAKDIDPNGTKRISFEEFLPIFVSASQKKHRGGVDDFIEGLKVFDRDGSGQVSAAELRHVLTGLGERMKDEDIDLLFSSVEENQGQINYEEFVKMVMNG